jgi:mRNA-degrading endonuclease RelE of RelBE toxin-antitoxin system
MWQVLSGRDTNKKFAKLSRPDRQAVVEILRETKKDLPGYFQSVTQ